MIDSFWTGAREALDELGLDDLPPLERLSRFLDRSYEGQVRCFKENGRVLGCPLGNLALELSTQDDVVGGRLRELFDAHVDRFERVISEAAARGEVEMQDPARTARALMALIEGGVMLAKMHDNPRILRDMKQHALRLVGAPTT